MYNQKKIKKRQIYNTDRIEKYISQIEKIRDIRERKREKSKFTPVDRVHQLHHLHHRDQCPVHLPLHHEL